VKSNIFSLFVLKFLNVGAIFSNIVQAMPY